MRPWGQNREPSGRRQDQLTELCPLSWSLDQNLYAGVGNISVNQWQQTSSSERTLAIEATMQKDYSLSVSHQWQPRLAYSRTPRRSLATGLTCAAVSQSVQRQQ